MKSNRPISSRLSFTLVEMMVSIAVVPLLMVMVFSILGYTMKISDSTGRGADSDIEAEQVLDRIGADIDGMVIRSDVDQFYYKAPGNDKMFFYSQQTGYFPSDAYYAANQSPIALVGYRINTSDNPSALPTLERLGRGLTVSVDNNPSGTTTAPMQFLSFPVMTSSATYQPATGGTITNQWGANENKIIPSAGSQGDVGTASGNYDDGTSPYYHIVGSQVFRFEICFQRWNGTFSLYPGYTNCAPVYPDGYTNTIAVVVAVAALDSKSRNLVPAASWGKLIAALPDPTDNNLSANTLMDAVWNNALNDPAFAATPGISPLVASHVKVYQRYYPLNAHKTQ